MKRILPIGRLIKTNSRGFLEKAISKNNLVSPWKEVVEDLNIVRSDFVKWLVK